MQRSHIWQVYPKQSNLSEKIADYFNCHPVIGQILLNRSIKDISEAKAFMSRSWDSWPTLPNQDQFMTLLHSLIEKKSPICIYGDYDVDGVTSIAIMVDILKRCGCIVDYIAPHRFDDGYGLNMNRMHEIARKI